MHLISNIRNNSTSTWELLQQQKISLRQVANYNCASAHNILIKWNSKHRITVLDDAPGRYKEILKHNDKKETLLYHARVMTNFTCNETKSDVDFNSCSYSLERRHFGTSNKYNNYTLGLLCNIQPGESSICHIYLFFDLFFIIYIIF